MPFSMYKIKYDGKWLSTDGFLMAGDYDLSDNVEEAISFGQKYYAYVHGSRACRILGLDVDKMRLVKFMCDGEKPCFPPLGFVRPIEYYLKDED